jgi:carbamate kinase
LRIVVALGGNALLRRGEPVDAESQGRNIAEAARIVAELAATHSLVVTHGNGPQVGLLALQSEALDGVAPYPLDVLGAESEGMIGYLLSRELRGRMPGKEVATLLTQAEIDPGDPAFETPSKPIGPGYDASQAEELVERRGWAISRESNGHFRRVVPSPEPKAILELEVIRLLLSSGVLVTCAGGGGIPVAREPDGSLRGVEAVVDKDLASALLATNLGADLLLLLTDQPGVYWDWPSSASTPIRSADVETLRAHGFEPGTMGPKVEAACRFAAATGKDAAIGALQDASRILEGSTGTRVRRGRCR